MLATDNSCPREQSALATSPPRSSVSGPPCNHPGGWMSHLDGVLEQVSLTEPWALVETFSTLPRWRPQDVNEAADVIAGKLKSFRVPATVHEPSLYLSIPYRASVELGGRVFKAKTPSYSKSVPNGV